MPRNSQQDDVAHARPRSHDRRELLAGGLAVGATAIASGGAVAAEGSRAWEYLSARNAKALLVWEEGRVTTEHYAPKFGSTSPHELWSGSKSFWGPAAACLIQDRLLSGYDELASSTVTEWRDDPGKARVTVRQLLSLQSGLDPGERGPGRAPTFAEAIQAPMRDSPGVRFRYGPANYAAFGELVRRKLGVSDNMAPVEYLERRLLRPMGVELSDWRQERGTPVLQGGALLTAPNWLRYGRCILDGGRWEGRQIIPKALLAECFHPSPANPAYGLTWWLNRGRREGAATEMGEDFAANFRNLARGAAIARRGPADLVAAIGGSGQRLYITPSRKSVVVIFSGTQLFNDAEVVGRLYAS